MFCEVKSTSLMWRGFGRIAELSDELVTLRCEDEPRGFEVPLDDDVCGIDAHAPSASASFLPDRNDLSQNRLSFHVFSSLLHCVSQILIPADVILFEDCPRTMTADCHSHTFACTAAHKISHTGPPQIMHQFFGQELTTIGCPFFGPLL